MKKAQWIASLSLVALSLASCTSNSNTSTAPTPQPSVGQVAARSKKQASQSPKKIVTPTRSEAVPAPPPGIFKPTKVGTIQAGRRDPFSVVPPVQQLFTPETKKQQDTKQTVIKKQAIKKQAIKQQVIKKQAIKQQVIKKQAIKRQEAKTKPKLSAEPKVAILNKQTAPLRKVVPSPVAQIYPPMADKIPVISSSPAPLPSTDLASAVQVTGVVQVESKVVAIVNAPTEKISRYVSAGEYLSNGQVLVKRIEFASNKEPVVVLEQNGVEVVKSVGSTSGAVASAM
ncbi:hypothetical protein H6F77_14575 [Microcoleus sp. FACHB-831]|uniref:hypothetical protein n=1 Tax=Microcoleus sp. FACHB-831 TaxID=2692827 RepID=UPI001685A92F|nr:hypothetical protein [Microcoleus sp. FACHB-831]MBD1922298.1 hypothetical protein [Microcoleus sp. FACHB-831]